MKNLKMPYAIYRNGKHKYFRTLDLAKLDKELFGGTLSNHNGYYWTIMGDK